MLLAVTVIGTLGYSLLEGWSLLARPGMPFRQWSRSSLRENSDTSFEGEEWINALPSLLSLKVSPASDQEDCPHG